MDRQKASRFVSIKSFLGTLQTELSTNRFGGWAVFDAKKILNVRFRSIGLHTPFTDKTGDRFNGIKGRTAYPDV